MEVLKKFKPLDDEFPLERQLGISAAPIVLINIFTVGSADEAGFLDAFTAAAGILTKQPGYISTQMHRAIGDSPIFLNYVEWESTETLRDAFARPEFMAKVSAYPPSVSATPHLFQKVAVPGFCTA
ncbi:MULTISPECIES: antibiotic biosynthesis monooxygenase family protein [Dickeya]|uniref:Antibiotic biosynthesis monooxygenase n=1 Tax=Dickeya solani D s0432-1 TaxID=1231725 RepID=A0AAV3K6U8_9GAMM|nr:MULTISPECIES: antibiotic biosynthesis monooxygenase family protein [Dickeya]ANE74396.1 antibiotic biosynthesis monooxygenase [Dickeya solani IPO 2222]AUC41637.1 Antibiotic biosynthesis monooxygenase [Dickeya solani RNS 08.23.3.1.A]AUH10188.1 antibiotic biosynthesis monooxygenase [Dickeya solani D s0432-1]AUH14135.1 antibiotic biosynthesis monooxygenase [Dickeya solani]AYQ48866.1 Antibiotic biosynthesis monooxygenase [Dickeya solani]